MDDKRKENMEKKMKGIANSPRYLYENSNLSLEEFQKQYYGENVKWRD